MRTLMIGAGLLLAAGQAFADDPPPAGGGGGGDFGSGTPGGVTAAAPTAMGWSPQIIDNDLVLPKGGLGVYGAFGMTSTSQTAPPVPPATMGTTTVYHTEALGIGAGYGVIDKLTVGGEYVLPFYDGYNAFPNAGDFKLYGGYGILHDAKMALAAGAELDFGAIGSKGGTTTTLRLGATFRYNITPTLALFTGNPIAPSPVGEQLGFAFGNKTIVTFAIPVGVGWQAIPKLFAWAETTLVTFSDNTTVIFADSTPFEVGALYRLTHDIDLGGFVLDDFNRAGDSITLGVMARWYKL
jgi:hypothetical protein